MSTEINIYQDSYTNRVGVKGSYPEAPEAKLTPVRRSVSKIFGSKYAGTISLTPNSSATKEKKKKIVNWTLTSSILLQINFDNLMPSSHLFECH